MPSRNLSTSVVPEAGADWRCPRCDKLLGVIRSGQLHVRFARAHEYIVTLPATCTCRGCRTMSSRRL